MSATYDDERRLLAGVGGSKGPFFLIGLDETEQRYVLERIRERLKNLGQHLSLDGAVDASKSSSEQFLEGGTLELFQSKNWQILLNIDAIKKEKVATWVEALSSEANSYILVSRKKLDKGWLALQQLGLVFDVSDEKPWDKPQRQGKWLQAFVKSLGMDISPSGAAQACEWAQGDRQMLKSQVEAGAAIQGYSGELKLQSMGLEAQPQVWKWLDQIFQGELAPAMGQIEGLLADDPSGLSLLALLRQQWHGLLLSCSDTTSSSQTLSSRQRRLREWAQRVGSAPLREGALKIGSAMLDLKSSRDPTEVFQILICQLVELGSSRAAIRSY